MQCIVEEGPGGNVARTVVFPTKSCDQDVTLRRFVVIPLGATTEVSPISQGTIVFNEFFGQFLGILLRDYNLVSGR